MPRLSTSVAFTVLIGIMLARSAVGLSAPTPDKLTQPNSCIKAGAAAVLTDRELKDYRSLKSELEAALPNHTPTPAEDRLLRAVITGTTAWGGDCAGEKDPSNDLANAENWGPDRTVDAKLIRWLMVDHDAIQLVTSSGIDLRAARIAGPLYLSNTTVPFPMIIAHCLMGDINLSDAETRTMDFHGSSINSLSGKGVSVNGDLLINGGLTAAGSVDLTNAKIDGDLRCNSAHFKKTPESIAVALAQIKRNAYFNKVDTLGKIRLNRSTINGDLDFNDARFLETENVDHEGSAQIATAAQLQAAFVSVGGTLFWQRVSLSPTTLIDLSSTSVGTLWDDEADWPPSPFLYLDGFVYRKIAAEAPMTAGRRLEWLRRQPKNFRPQPYQQLAHVFEEAGLQGDATAVRVASEQEAYESAATGNLTSDGIRFWSFLLRWTIGYGYRPFLALIPIVFFVLLGTALFWSGYQRGVLTPVDKDAAEYFEKIRRVKNNPQLIVPSPPAGYQPFNAFFYSLESFLPLVKLHQEDFWLPNALKRKWGTGLRYYLWIHILAGWFFSAMLVAGVTGLVHSQ